jgi:hypothetical protein
LKSAEGLNPSTQGVYKDTPLKRKIRAEIYKLRQRRYLRNVQNTRPLEIQCEKPIANLCHCQFLIFETMNIPLLPNSPHKAQMVHSPHLQHHFISSLAFPTSKEINNPTIHDPLHIKKGKKNTP